MSINNYESLRLTNQDLIAGKHRDQVGGMWDLIGKLQFDYMIAQGLKPSMQLLDVGCGCLRGGLYFVRYLDKGNYFGIDSNLDLIQAGYEIELASAGLQDKIPRSNLTHDSHFDVAVFKQEFDYAIAQSVFTHLPLNHIRVCLIKLCHSMKTGGKFYSTFFECPSYMPIEKEIKHVPGEITTCHDQDPYHYKIDDFAWCIRDLAWKLEYVGEWNHPRSQKMLCFIKK